MDDVIGAKGGMSFSLSVQPVTHSTHFPDGCRDEDLTVGHKTATRPVEAWTYVPNLLSTVLIN